MSLKKLVKTKASVFVKFGRNKCPFSAGATYWTDWKRSESLFRKRALPEGSTKKIPDQFLPRRAGTNLLSFCFLPNIVAVARLFGLDETIGSTCLRNQGVGCFACTFSSVATRTGAGGHDSRLNFLKAEQHTFSIWTMLRTETVCFSIVVQQDCPLFKRHETHRFISVDFSHFWSPGCQLLVHSGLFTSRENDSLLLARKAPMVGVFSTHRLSLRHRESAVSMQAIVTQCDSTTFVSTAQRWYGSVLVKFCNLLNSLLRWRVVPDWPCRTIQRCFCVTPFTF